jgi:capsular exopolysaccharide synthesis family protein
METSMTYLLPGQDPSSSKVSTINLLWTVIRRRRWVILAGFLPVSAAVAAYTFTIPKTYTSWSTVLVEARGQQQENSALEVLQRLGRTNTLETEIELITSRRVIEPIVEQQAMHVSVMLNGESVRGTDIFSSVNASREAEPGKYIIEPRSEGVIIIDAETEATIAEIPAKYESAEVSLGGLSLALPGDLQFNEISISVAPFEGAVVGIQNRIAAAPVRRDADLIRLTCQEGSPEQAHNLCENVTKSYLQLRADLQHAEAAGAADFLAEQVEQVKSRLTAAEDKLATYQSENQAVALDQRASTEVQQHARVRAQREQLEAERSALATLLSATENEGGSRNYRDLASYPTFMQTQNRIVGQLVETLVDLENRRSELTITRTERNPDVAAIDSRILEIENQLKDFAVSYQDGLTAQITSLNQSLGSASGQLSVIPVKQVETARLSRQVTLLEDLYQFLQVRLREAEVAEMVNLPSVGIVDRASFPFHPSAPNVRMNLALGLLLGLCVGGALAAIRELTDSRIRERRDVERETGVPVLAMIPTLRHPGPIAAVAGNGAAGKRLIRESPAASDGGGELAKVAASRDLWEEELVIEAFRSLAADLRFTGQRLGTRGLRSVAVTSASRGDGKTFTACNLAIAQAVHGRKTLLLDADLRASGVARFFDLAWTSAGLTDVLTGQAETPSVLQELDLRDGGQLRIISAGNPQVRSVGMLEKHAMRVGSLLDYGEEHFDLVVVDTPPLNVLTDAATIASRVDAVVVVVRGGVTDRSALDLTLKRLTRANARVVGLVLNDVDLPEYYTTYSHDYITEFE